jgi:hypothetical protein
MSAKKQITAHRILTNQVIRKAMEFFKKRLCLLVRHVLEDLLQHSAAVWVSSQSERLPSKGFADEEVDATVDTLQRSLEDVVGILILSTLDDFSFQLLDEKVLLRDLNKL